jgi:uncharacterized protein (DUF305 family)
MFRYGKAEVIIMIKRILFLGAALLLTVALAQQDPHHPDQQATSTRTRSPVLVQNMPGQGPMNQMGPTGQMDMMPMMQMMQGMMGQMMEQMPMGMMGGSLTMLSGPAFEQAFLSMMIPHHESAVEMSRAVLSSTSDADVRALAEAIISAQEQEIEQMQSWLSELGGTNLAAQAMMSQGMNDMMTMTTSSQTADPDKAFLERMTTHHLSAIDMAAQALQKASDPRIVELAAAIVSEQASEVLQIRQKLATLNE